MAHILPSGTYRLSDVSSRHWRIRPSLFSSPGLTYSLLHRRARDARSEQLVAVKNLRVSAQLDSAKRALREVEMLKHFRGTENVCI